MPIDIVHGNKHTDKRPVLTKRAQAIFTEADAMLGYASARSTALSSPMSSIQSCFLLRDSVTPKFTDYLDYI